MTIKSASYDYGQLRDKRPELPDPFCRGKIGRGSRVLIKPNLPAPARPERAVVTHPLEERS